MARKPRIEFPHALYHVIARGNQRKNIFWESADYSRYLGLVNRYKIRYDFSLFAYALMTNHVHMLIETGDAPLSKIMQGLQQTYTQFFNWKYDQIGHVFQGRYKALLCQKDIYLIELVRYVHLNPIRAGIVNDLKQYPWISHHIYVRSASHPLVDRESVLGLFHSSRAQARQLYMQFLHDGMKEGHTAFLDDAYEGRILGERPFVAEVCRHIDNENKDCSLPAGKPALADILKIICDYYRVRSELMKLKIKTATAVHVRCLFSYIARVHYQYSLREISSFLGIDQSTVSKQVQRTDHAIRSDQDAENRITLLYRRIKNRNADFQA